MSEILSILTDLYELDVDVRGDEGWTTCPFIDHPDRTPSFSVNLDSGVFHCFGCGRSGNLISLGATLWKMPYEDVERKIMGEEGASRMIRSKIRRVLTPSEVVYHPTKYGPYESGPLTYLTRKGYKKETLIRWGVRFVTRERLRSRGRNYVVTSSIAIPLIDHRGIRVGWIYRRTDSSHPTQPKYLYTPGLPVGATWFGLYFARISPLLVVEGALDAIWASQAGFAAVALLGASVSEQKLSLLRQFSQVVLMFDKDVAGTVATKKVGDYLSQYLPVRVVLYPKHTISSQGRRTDPTDFPPEQLKEVVKKAVPYRSWINRKKLSERLASG